PSAPCAKQTFSTIEQEEGGFSQRTIDAKSATPGRKAPGRDARGHHPIRPKEGKRMARAGRRLGWAALAVGVLLVLGGPAGAETAADPKVVDPILFEAPGVPGGTLTLSVLSSPRSFNYYGVIDNVTYEIMGQVLSPLVGRTRSPSSWSRAWLPLGRSPRTAGPSPSTSGPSAGPTASPSPPTMWSSPWSTWSSTPMRRGTSGPGTPSVASWSAGRRWMTRRCGPSFPSRTGPSSGCSPTPSSCPSTGWPT